jgi:hypothetical protein
LGGRSAGGQPGTTIWVNVAHTHGQWVVGPSGTTIKVALTRPVTVILSAHITRGDEDVSALLNYALVERQRRVRQDGPPRAVLFWNFAEAGR